MNIRISLRAAASVLALVSLSIPTFAADPYPSKPVKFVIPFPAGSAPDLLLRHRGTELTVKWGHQVVIDNKPGGSGVIGMKGNIELADVGRATVPHPAAEMLGLNSGT